MNNVVFSTLCADQGVAAGSFRGQRELEGSAGTAFPGEATEEGGSRELYPENLSGQCDLLEASP